MSADAYNQMKKGEFTMRIKKNLLLSAVILILAGSLFGQSSALYVSVLQTQSYIVGGKNPPTGLYFHKQDTVWGHLGWDNVRNFGATFVPGQSNTMYLACGNGVFRTRDGGQNWKITTGWEITEVLDIAVQPGNPAHLLAATAYGIWSSDNSGETWSEANSGIEHTFTQTIRFDRTARNRVLAGSEETLYYSDDGGKNWRSIGPKDITIRTVEQSPVDPDLWMAGTMDEGILRSGDGGRTWNRLSGTIRDETIYAIAFHPGDPSRIAAGGFDTGVLISGDGGKTWEKTEDDLPVSDIHSLAFDPDQSGRIWAGTVGRGVYYSDDNGASWHYAGLNGSEVWDMMFVVE